MLDEVAQKFGSPLLVFVTDMLYICLWCMTFSLLQFMYSYCCLYTCILIVRPCILIVVYVFLSLSMYSYCCLCILIFRPCILIVVYVYLLLSVYS